MNDNRVDLKREFTEGIRGGIPICLGYIAVSFAFGIQATEAGLTPFQAAVMSLTNVTSAGQFASLDLIARQGALIELAFVQFIINLRYMLMSTALTQKLSQRITTFQRMKIAYGVTDEIFGVSVLRSGNLEPAFSYGIILISVFGWVLGTTLGAIAGEILPARLISALGVAIYGMFIAIIIPETKKSKAVLAVVAGAFALSTLFTYAPVLSGISSGFRIIIITILIAGVAAFLAPVPDQAAEEKGGAS